jgi:hypothetical protein
VGGAVASNRKKWEKKNIGPYSETLLTFRTLKKGRQKDEIVLSSKIATKILLFRTYKCI